MKQNGRVSPRTPSQQSVHSAHSEKGSKASASPLHNQTILPQHNAVGGPSSIPSTLEKKDSNSNADSHAAKVARMEVAASQGLSGGIPPKIEEVAEPD